MHVQAVVVDGKISSISKVLSGVPQGSVLGPILFILYINDVVDSLPTSTTCKLFADDLKMYSVLNIINDANSIFSAFENIKQWASIWQLQINESKSNWLFIGRTASSFNNAYIASDNNVCRLFLALMTLAFLWTAISVLVNILMT